MKATIPFKRFAAAVLPALTLSLASVATAYADEFAEGSYMDQLIGLNAYSGNSKAYTEGWTASGVQSIKSQSGVLQPGYGGVMGRLFDDNGRLVGSTTLWYDNVPMAFNQKYQILAYWPYTAGDRCRALGECYGYHTDTGRYEVFYPAPSPYVR